MRIPAAIAAALVLAGQAQAAKVGFETASAPVPGDKHFDFMRRAASPWPRSRPRSARAAFHKTFNAAVVRFFQKTLK